MPIKRTSRGVMIDCPAKLNLTLAVGPPRADGQHPIASVMTAMDLSDTLTLSPLEQGPSRFTRVWMRDAPRTLPIDWPIESDLIYRAHALMQREAGRTLAIECKLEKRIPAGAGLGGGSSNAAGMLFGLRELFELRIDAGRLIALGSKLGSDVGFAVGVQLDQHAALVTGIGEVIEPLTALPGFDAALVLPDGDCPTGEVYAAYDAILGEGAEPGDTAARASAWRGLHSRPTPMNDLTEAAMRVCPGIGQAVDTLAKLNLSAHVTGSGSAVFILADNESQAAVIADRCHEAGLAASPLSHTSIDSRL